MPPTETLLLVPGALAAGALSFASPCVLPLVPGYLGFVGGLDRAGVQPAGSRRLVLGAALFVLGFSVVFVLATVVSAQLGAFLVEWRELLTRVLGAVVILLGLVFAGVLGPLQRLVKPTWQPRSGLIGAPLLGIVFAIGWSPCITPTLGAIVTLSARTGSAPEAALLGLLYSLGLGMPFVLLAAGVGWATKASAFLKRHVRVINAAGGALLVLVGLLMVSGVWARVLVFAEGLVT